MASYIIKLNQIKFLKLDSNPRYWINQNPKEALRLFYFVEVGAKDAQQEVNNKIILTVKNTNLSEK